MSYFAVGGLAVTGAYSYLKGASQKREANKLADANKFPDQQIPQAILENRALVQSMGNQGLPAVQYNRARQNIDRTAAGAMRGATDRRGGLGTLGIIQTGTNDALLNLDVQDANALRQNKQQVIQNNKEFGSWQDKTWDWNKRQQYIQKAAAVRALMGAGNQNENSGIDRISSAAIFGGNQLSGNPYLIGKNKKLSAAPVTGGNIDDQYSSFYNENDFPN